MIYALIIWTIVAQSNNNGGAAAYGWRPVAEFQDSTFIQDAGYVSAKSKCEAAASELGLKINYRCIRTK